MRATAGDGNAVANTETPGEAIGRRRGEDIPPGVQFVSSVDLCLEQRRFTSQHAVGPQGRIAWTVFLDLTHTSLPLVVR